MPEEHRTLGYLEGQIDGIHREIAVLRGEVQQVRTDARADRATSDERIVGEIHELRDEARDGRLSLNERVARLETAVSRNQGEDSAEAQMEAHGHSWRQTITQCAFSFFAGVVGAIAALLASWKH